MEEQIKISRTEYEFLSDRLYFLECLECVGVDNWSGYEYALDEYKDYLKNKK